MGVLSVFMKEKKNVFYIGTPRSKNDARMCILIHVKWKKSKHKSVMTLNFLYKINNTHTYYMYLYMYVWV